MSCLRWCLRATTPTRVTLSTNVQQSLYIQVQHDVEAQKELDRQVDAVKCDAGGSASAGSTTRSLLMRQGSLRLGR